MRVESREYKDGSIVLGVSGNIIFLPLIQFPTWSDYMSFIEEQCEFIAESYRQKVNNLNLIRELNKIECLDDIGSDYPPIPTP
jgi:hypothetical protein